MQISNDWFVAETEFENKSLIIRGRLFLDAIRQSGKFATRIALVWEYQGDEKGMPTEKASTRNCAIYWKRKKSQY